MSELSIKSVYLADYQPIRPSFIQQHVSWLKEDRKGINRLAIAALASLEAVSLAATGIGWFIIYKGIQESKQIDKYKKFYEQVERTPKPSKAIEIDLRSATQAYNHTHEFLIENDFIWSRVKGKDQRVKGKDQDDWKPMYFDGFPKKIPKRLHADGANLIVLDQDNRVHYRKVISEYRGEEVAKDPKAQQKLQNQEIADASYIAIDKTDKNNWKDKWFSLPVVHLLGNIITGKLLQLPKDSRAWAISHRGRYNDYLEDAVGQRHPVEAGVTTLYLLDKNGTCIFKYDPWSPKHAKMNLFLPETSTYTFEALNLDASASHLMAIGYQISPNQTAGKGTIKELKILTRLADIDSEGWNPGLKYDYAKNEADPDVRVLSLPQWIEHPLVLENGDPIQNIGERVTIQQTGEGNQARELRVAGRLDNETGYYYKQLTDKHWQFKATPSLSSDQPLDLKIESDQPFETTAAHYKSEGEGKISMGLMDFGQRASESKVRLTIDNQDFDCRLYRKKTLKNFFGFEGDSFELVLPDISALSEPAKEILKNTFNGKRAIPVKVDEQTSQIKMKSRFFNLTLKKENS